MLNSKKSPNEGLKGIKTHKEYMKVTTGRDYENKFGRTKVDLRSQLDIEKQN
jgi:hypothetical protein